LQLGDIGAAASLMFYHLSIHETRYLDEELATTDRLIYDAFGYMMDDAVLDLTARLSGLLTSDGRYQVAHFLCPMEAGGGSSESPGYNLKFPE
jgi:hypothetical protein